MLTRNNRLTFIGSVKTVSEKIFNSGVIELVANLVFVCAIGSVMYLSLTTI